MLFRCDNATCSVVTSIPGGFVTVSITSASAVVNGRKGVKSGGDSSPRPPRCLVNFTQVLSTTTKARRTENTVLNPVVQSDLEAC